MLDILNQIESAKNANLYYVALFSALSVADIAGALDEPNGRASKDAYAKWFNAHVRPKYQTTWGNHLDGMDCYYFRCSMLHQGTAILQNSKAGITRIFFLEPGNSGLVMHNNLINNALNVDVNIFCQDIVDAARAWHATASKTPLYQTNAAKCVGRHPSGLAPFVAGVPCIG